MTKEVRTPLSFSEKFGLFGVFVILNSVIVYGLGELRDRYEPVVMSKELSIDYRNLKKDDHVTTKKNKSSSGQ